MGTFSRATGEREGGLLGLSAKQMEWVQSARDELADPDRLRDYLKRKKRDRRYDRTVAKAIREGKPLTAQQRETMARRYADRLLAFRGEAIARTETQRAVHAGNARAFAQLIETGAVNPNQVRRIWRSVSDKRTRDSHFALHSQSVGYGETFESPITGARLRYPGDPDAPAAETVNCRCWMETRIDFLGNIS